MDQKVKADWVDALRSGKYKQATNALRAGDTFCCLGVLCDMSNLGGWGPDGSYRDGQDFAPDVLPKGVADWAGLDTASPEVEFGYEDAVREADGEAPDAYQDAPMLAELNDAGFSFSQIADVIAYFL